MRHASTCVRILALLAAPALIAGADPNGQRRPSTDHGAERPGFNGAARGPGGPGGKEEFEKFREDMQAFCKAHSPNRWAALEEAAKNSGGPVKFGGMFFRFRGLMMLANEDKALYEIKVRQIEIEDKEFGLMKDLREAKKNEKTADVERITADLRKLADEYVAKRFEERTHRVAKLEKVLNDERSALASEQGRKDALVDEHLDAVLREAPIPRPYGPGPGGPGSRGPTGPGGGRDGARDGREGGPGGPGGSGGSPPPPPPRDEPAK